MADDKLISQLVSKSLRHDLSGDERSQVDEHLKENDEARKFAEISQIIQQSLSISGQQDIEDDNSVGLSHDAKNRLRESISLAVDVKLSESQIGGKQPAEEQLVREVDGDRRELASRFQLIRLLSKGGLGNVWLARDKRLNRTVAIKELHRESLESPQAWDRFRREAEITGHLEHPNVVPIYQFGEDRKTGEPFYAMRFVGKRTLADAIEEHHDRIAAGDLSPVNTHRLLSVFLDVCQAIAYAHSRGVIHRDLKPDNVALDNFGQVIVLDWGLAKVLEDGELANKLTESQDITDSVLSQTLQGDVVGTPLFMAPEQAAGKPDLIDHRTDVYGLGAILFAILSGQAPHEKSVSVRKSQSLNTVLQAIAEGETPRAGELGDHVSRELDEICAKAMARKRHMRFESVQQLADAVEHWTAGQSGKQAAYDALRMEGRELRADLKSAVNDLERNVRFMSTLPPIQELIKAEEPETVTVWRERLAQIFHGLLRANSKYQSVAYSKVENGEFSEVVRVERHSTDSSSIRVVPKSKLQTAANTDHINELLNQHPDEVLSALACGVKCDDQDNNCKDDVDLVVGVPVYNEQTEEVFGVVQISCDIYQVLRQQMVPRLGAAEIVVACDIFHVLSHFKAGQILEESSASPISTITPHFEQAVKHLQTQPEYIDAANAEIYGGRLWLIPNVHGVMYLLKRSND